MIITLSWYEIIFGASVGIRRRVESLRGKHTDRHGGEPLWNEDIEGALAEMVVAKARGKYWNGGVGTYKGGDVGNVQVRYTPLADGSLILRKGDSPDSRYVLVTGQAPTYNVIGWIDGHDGMKPEFVWAPNGRPPAYFVPQNRLENFTNGK